MVKGGGLKVDVQGRRGDAEPARCRTEEQKQRAEKLAKKVKGVKQVVNQHRHRE